MYSSLSLFLEEPCLEQRPKSTYSPQQLIRGKYVLIREVFPAPAKQWPLFLEYRPVSKKENVPISRGSRGLLWVVIFMHSHGSLPACMYSMYGYRMFCGLHKKGVKTCKHFWRKIKWIQIMSPFKSTTTWIWTYFKALYFDQVHDYIDEMIKILRTKWWKEKTRLHWALS